MGKFSALFDKTHWRTNLNFPVIETGAVALRGDALTVSARTEPEILDHFNVMPHVRRMSVYFYPETPGSSFFQGQAELVAVSELLYDKHTDTISTRQEISIQFKPEDSGTIYASSYSNFFGMKRNSKAIVLG